MQYRRRIEVYESGETSISETLAIARTQEVSGDSHDSLPVSQLFPLQEPRSGLRSKARQLLRRLKP
jgi:hypothetical protein